LEILRKSKRNSLAFHLNKSELSLAYVIINSGRDQGLLFQKMLLNYFFLIDLHLSHFYSLKKDQNSNLLAQKDHIIESLLELQKKSNGLVKYIDPDSSMKLYNQYLNLESLYSMENYL
jgi:hypothetical protein